MLAAVGGQAIAVPRGGYSAGVGAIPSFAAAQKSGRWCPPCLGGPRLDAVTDPHELELLDYCVAPGEFGVAENAAVWISQTDGATSRVAGHRTTSGAGRSSARDRAEYA